MRLEVFLLGRFDVLRDGVAVAAWPRAGVKRLLKLLALAPKHALPVARLAETLWPQDYGERVRQRLHHLVYLLRTALGEGGSDAVRLHDGQVHLAAAPLWVDVAAFEAAAQAGLPGGDEAALQAALELYGGPLLPGDIDDPALNARRQALEHRHAELLHARAALQARRGAMLEAVHSLNQVLQRAPADERAHRTLITLYAGLQRRADAERQYTACKAAMSAELGVPPSALTHQAYRAALLQPAEGTAPADPPTPRAVPPVPLVPLIDRDALVDAIAARLAEPATRLLTLVGAGGLGKTQLALRVGHELQARYRHGVVFVSLAEVAGSGVADRIRRALRLAEPAATDTAGTADALTDALRDRHLLLVCDNCEHVVDRLHLLTELLAQCPLLTVLATSRRRLNLRAEQVIEVPALRLDDGSAARLFVQRAQAAAPGFTLHAGNRDDVQALVEQLQGVPLSIELVAARVALLPPAELLRALAHGPGVVAGGGPDRPPRHRSMQASLAWSRSLLSPLERHVLDRSALFAAPFVLPALAAVCGDLTADVSQPAQALRELGLLVHVQAVDEAPRWHLLASTRAFVRGDEEGGAGSMPAEGTARRFVEWATGLAGTLAARLAGAQAAQALAECDAEHENFFAALALAQPLGDAALLCCAVKALIPCWARTGAWSRADPWVLQATEAATSLPAADRAAFQLAAAGYWHECQQPARTRALADAVLAHAQAAGNAPLHARATVLLSSALYHLGEGDAAIAPLERLIPTLHGSADAPLRRAALNNLANSALCAGDLARARAAWIECDAQFHGEATPARVAYVHNLSLVAHYVGQDDAALTLSQQAEAFEQAAAARPQRLVQIHLRRCWMACCRAEIAPAEAALAQAREAVARAHLAAWQPVCAAHEGKLALLSGQVERAIALLQRAAGQEPGRADPWDALDLRLWLFWAHLPSSARDLAPAGAVLAGLVADHRRHWRLEHPRLLEAAAAWLLRAGQPAPAGRAWLQAQALRRAQGLRRFAVEQPAARRTQAGLAARLGRGWQRAPQPVPAGEPLDWLLPLLRG